MTKTKIKELMKYPDNVHPCKMLMIEVIFYWMQDTGQAKDLHTNGLHDIRSHYEIAMDYYKVIFGKGNAKGVYLDTKNMNLDRFES